MKRYLKSGHPSEAAIQRAYFAWVELKSYAYPDLLTLIFAIPNGGSRHPIEARNLRLSGVRAGVPDVFVSLARHGKYGMYIEFKSGNGVLSEKQESFMLLAIKNNYRWNICRTVEEAIRVTEEYLAI